MDSKKQKLLIEYLISSADTFAVCQGIINPIYFDPELRHSVTFIKEYYNNYSSTPNPTQIEAETDVTFETHTINNDQIKYCSTEIEAFCKRRALEQAILASPDLISNGDFGKVESNIRDAIMVSLNHDLGLRYFEDPEERLNRMLEENPVESTGWTEVDNALFGGIARKEMILFAGNSGAGKSVTLANLGFNFMERGKNVLLVSLELSEDVIAQRFDTMFTGISRRDWKSHIGEITTRLSSASDDHGILDIIRLPSGACSNDILAYLKEYHLQYHMMPDLLVVDYLDKMSPNEKNISASDVWTKDKLCAEQLRDIGNTHNLLVATASQLNRSSVGSTDHDHSQIAGGISKINETDVYISLIATDTMKAAGEILFIFQKTRNSDGVGQKIMLKWDNKYLRITDHVDTDKGLTFNKRDDNQLTDTENQTQSLMNLLTSTNSTL